MPRNFATLGPSELQPPFTGVSENGKKPFSLILQHWAGVSLNTSSYELAKTCELRIGPFRYRKGPPLKTVQAIFHRTQLWTFSIRKEILTNTALSYFH